MNMLFLTANVSIAMILLLLSSLLLLLLLSLVYNGFHFQGLKKYTVSMVGGARLSFQSFPVTQILATLMQHSPNIQ